jgi:hypothetical protein
MVTKKDKEKLNQKLLTDMTPYDKEYEEVKKEEQEIIMRIVDHEHVLTWLEQHAHKLKTRKEELKKLMEEYKQ